MASVGREKVEIKELQSLVEERKSLFLKARKLDDQMKQLKDKTMQVSLKRNEISTRMLEVEDAISTKVTEMRNVEKVALKIGQFKSGITMKVKISEKSASVRTLRKPLVRGNDEVELLLEVEEGNKETKAMKLGVKRENEDPAAVLFCQVCPSSKSFSGAAAFTAHLKSHKLEKKIDCSSPGCKFSGKLDALRNHARARHTKESVFTCPRCPVMFFNFGARMTHLKKHQETKIYRQCGSCWKVFQRSKGSCRCGGREASPSMLQ